MAIISTRIGLINGPGEKLNRLEPTPETNMAVKIPKVAPRVSTVIKMAFIGKTTEPKTKAMRMKVATRM